MNTVQGIRGSQEPLYRSVPDGAVQTWGPAFIELAASIDITLDPGQGAILSDGLSTRADGRWLAKEVDDIEPRQNGKSLLFEARALGGAYLIKEPLIIWTAHEFKTAKRSFLSLKDKITNWDHLRKRVRTIRQSGATTEIELFNPTRTIAFLARSGGSGRGFAQVSPLLLDEGFALSPEDMAALQYAMSAAPNPQAWIASSAPLTTSEVLRDICRDGRKGGSRTVYYEWSARGKFSDLKALATRNRARIKDGLGGDAEFIARTLESNRSIGRPGGVGISIEAAEEELKKSTDVEIFMRERWGVYSELEAGGKIAPDEWDALADPESHRVGDVAIALDISIDRDWSAIGMYGIREDGKGHVQLIDYRPGTDWVIGALKVLRETLQPIAVGMGRGTYASLKEALKDAGFLRPEDRPPVDPKYRQEGDPAHQPERGDLCVMGGPDMAAACGRFLDMVRQGTMRHVPADQLTSAARVAQTRVVGDCMTWVKTDRSVDITGLVAVTQAPWVFESRIGMLRAYDPAEDLF